MISGAKKYQLITDLMPLFRYGCQFRLVDLTDADFIYKLRMNPELSKFLNPIEGDAENQRKWITEYKKRESSGNEFYFIDLDPDSGARQGVIRIYNFSDNTFVAGSWVYPPDLNFNRAILGDIIVKEIAFDILGFEYCSFSALKGNKSVIKYQQLFSSELIREDDKFLYYVISKDTFNEGKVRVMKFLGIDVE